MGRRPTKKNEGAYDWCRGINNLDRAFNRVILVWFAANREEATASLTAAKLHKTFAEACKCEDAQCDSIEGRAGCSDNIDVFA